MSGTTTPVTLTHARLPQWAPVLVGVMALAAAGLPAMLLGWGIFAWLVAAVALFLVGLPGWSLVVENRRAATDRLMTGLIWTAFGCAVLPLLWLIYVVVSQGAQADQRRLPHLLDARRDRRPSRAASTTRSSARC